MRNKEKSEAEDTALLEKIGKMRDTSRLRRWCRRTGRWPEGWVAENG